MPSPRYSTPKVVPPEDVWQVLYDQITKCCLSPELRRCVEAFSIPCLEDEDDCTEPVVELIPSEERQPVQQSPWRRGAGYPPDFDEQQTADSFAERASSSAGGRQQTHRPERTWPLVEATPVLDTQKRSAQSSNRWQSPKSRPGLDSSRAGRVAPSAREATDPDQASRTSIHPSFSKLPQPGQHEDALNWELPEPQANDVQSATISLEEFDQQPVSNRRVQADPSVNNQRLTPPPPPLGVVLPATPPEADKAVARSGTAWDETATREADAAELCEPVSPTSSVASPSSPKKVRFGGTQERYDDHKPLGIQGQWNKGRIDGNILTSMTGEEIPIVWQGKSKIAMQYHGETYTAELRSGTLCWDDGDTWTKKPHGVQDLTARQKLGNAGGTDRPDILWHLLPGSH